jgi:hypothetical protein
MTKRLSMRVPHGWPRVVALARWWTVRRSRLEEVQLYEQF